MKNFCGHIISLACVVSVMFGDMCSVASAQSLDNIDMVSRLVRIDDNLEPDKAIDSIVDMYRSEIDQKMLLKIGYSDERMVAKRPDSNLMRFVADATLYGGQAIAQDLNMPLPVVALANTGGLRTSIDEGDVTIKSIFEVSPFENSLVFLTVDGRVMREMANHIASRGGEPVSGMTLTISGSSAVDILVDGKNIDDDATYVVATNNYLADGGDGFSCLLSAQRVSTDYMVRDVIIKYIQFLSSQGLHINASSESRIKVISNGN